MMNTGKTQSNNGEGGLRIDQAVRMAMLRKVARLASMQGALQELQWLPFITASELMLLEDNGFLLDFDTGLCVDTWPVLESADEEAAA